MAVLERMADMAAGGRYDDVRDLVDDAIGSYAEFGEALTELLRYFGGGCGYDNEAADLIARMLRDYLDATV